MEGKEAAAHGCKYTDLPPSYINSTSGTMFSQCDTQWKGLILLSSKIKSKRAPLTPLTLVGSQNFSQAHPG